MGGCEGGDLNQDRLPGTAEEEESEDEEDMVKAFGQDMFEALFDVTYKSRPGSGIGRMRADAPGGRAGRGFGGEAGKVEGEACLAGEHDHEAGVFLAVDGVGEDRGDLVAGEGADFPARHAGGDLGLPFAAGHDGIGHREERLTRLGDEVPGKVGLDPADGFEGEL